MVGFEYRVILCYQVQYWMRLDRLKGDCWALAGVCASKSTSEYMSLKIQVTKHSFNDTCCTEHSEISIHHKCVYL